MNLVFEEELGLLRRERAEDLLDDVELVDLTFSRKQWLPVDELTHDAPDRPHVNRFAVPAMREFGRQRGRGSGGLLSEEVIL